MCKILVPKDKHAWNNVLMRKQVFQISSPNSNPTNQNGRTSHRIPLSSIGQRFSLLCYYGLAMYYCIHSHHITIIIISPNIYSMCRKNIQSWEGKEWWENGREKAHALVSTLIRSCSNSKIRGDALRIPWAPHSCEPNPLTAFWAPLPYPTHSLTHPLTLNPNPK